MPDRDLNIRHPDYDRMLTRWILEHDFYRGGIHVLQPAQYKQQISWLAKREAIDTSTQPETARTESRFTWQSGSSNTYLHKHLREGLNSWKERQQRAHHIPLFKPTVNIFAAAVLKTGPDVQNADPSWERYYADVDMDGTDISLNRREVLSLALVFGRMHSITDMTSSDRPLQTMRQQRDSGVRAYSANVCPFDLTNWSTDDKGRFQWVQIREDMPDTRYPGDAWPEQKSRYRIWYPGHWELWQPTETRGEYGKWSVVARGEHPCQEVPLSTCWARFGSKGMLGVESPLCDVADVDRAVYNKFSLLDELLYKQTFSIFAVGRREGSPFTDIEVGAGMGMYYDAEAGPPVYVSPDAAQVLALWSIIKETISLIKTASEAGRGLAEQSIEARSAAAIGAEYGDRNNVMAELAEGMEQFEAARNRQVAAWGKTPTVPTVSYSRRFDLRSINQQLTDLVQVKNLEVGARVLSALTKPVLVRILKESGVSDDEIATVTGQLEGDMQKQAERAAEEMQQRQTSWSSDAQADARADA